MSRSAAEIEIRSPVDPADLHCLHARGLGALQQRLRLIPAGSENDPARTLTE